MSRHDQTDISRPASAATRADAILTAARLLQARLETGTPIDTAFMRAAMEAAFGGTDAEGTWDWKTAYDAGEAAQILFLRKYAAALRRQSPHAALKAIERVAALLPRHTRRSETSVALDQFSTPAGLAFVATFAASVGRDDLLLEPSAGTGLIAIQGERDGAALVLNELGATRAALLARLFPDAVLRHDDAAHIDDYLPDGVAPNVVVMNPPFSAVAHVSRAMKGTALRHIASAFARLAPGGRLVAITAAGCSPYAPDWADDYAALQAHGRMLLSAAIDGRVYARHGTGIDTRLTVIEKIPADDPALFPRSPGTAPDTATLLDWVIAHVPPRRPPPATALVFPIAVSVPARASRIPAMRAVSPVADIAAVAFDYEIIDRPTDTAAAPGDAIYEPYRCQSLRIVGAHPHPTPLVQSVAMASVAPPQPTYRPHLPAGLVEAGLLSEPQLESVIHAGEAHAAFLAGCWLVDETWDLAKAAPADAEGAVRFRRGWFLGDGTGAGKGRQVAGIILDNWLKGRRRALWISKSDTLLEDAQRDWSALGQERLLVTPLSRFRQGTPIALDKGILFTTYATLRSQDRGARISRLRQIVAWLGSDFDGVIVFDEAHAMANAAGGKGERGDVAASQQGRAGLRLQHALPDARIVYVSATGATTVQNLAYAQRLGLWGGADFPFAHRSAFVAAIEAGGVAAMEVLARDLKALGLYAARSLSFDGVEYALLEHRLTPEQIRIYDGYAAAFQVIHNNLDKALEAANVTSTGGTLNSQAKSAARSVFEGAKQRFFNHLITAMQTPSLVAAIERDLAEGHAAIVQIVSTGEALMARRLAEVPSEEWDDVQVDITPREYVLDYLAHGFPVQLYEPFEDGEGNILSRPVYVDGNPVECREAVRRRDRMIEQLAALPPVPGALDQILHRFGADQVAEVTGRSRRIVGRQRDDGTIGFAVENRPAAAGLAEAQAFMDDTKRILIFSDAGGTGRSYHADLGAANQRLRVHYLLEAGWKADNAIQGFGRTNRTNQKQPPRFRPVSTDVKAQKRFISTIARRLDTMGAITRGQRQAGGQNMFRPEDNLESWYARDALRQLYVLLAGGRIAGCPLARFEEATGLSLLDQGSLRDVLPPITTFLNRMLALPIALQNTLFTAFEDLLAARIQGAIAAGTYEVGLETLTADGFCIVDRRTIYTHPATRAETRLLTIERRDRNQPRVSAALLQDRPRDAVLLVNSRSGRAAMQIGARSVLLDNGTVEPRVRLIRPMEAQTLPRDAMAETHWEPANEARFSAAWDAEVAALPEYEISRMHIVTGLLLPIWKRLPNESSRVYRLRTDDGEQVVGRCVSPAWVASITDAEPSTAAPSELWQMLLAGAATLHLAEDLTLSRVRSMNIPRVELSGFSDLALDRLKACGLISEIISWKLRLFVPTGADGADAFARLLELYPLQRVAQRSPAKAA
ncbi:bifunctional class I SAM-dependent methyltransferase/DEAD/DEAH box helicase [Sphingomonas sp. AR_OL41]|uniref:bifunctional class I SAM-dependent methyltransferase/DEAD/DEAH box helicase n=1 Tax=Sphingomonas sp. AR_OL41 TaxID=3042729 RepID=UPI0024816350|nr:bifunctional class I SAM-dependent methyltransferase/DEAD/DEAH box helicase [Sphingomonas sp. AR_OL41]MDH7973926.1 bifunctional class I SAM-dependent methyltransferase/DEAD/DEAH box helicase [Sphingomonas sp. AR_OL41]